MSPPVPSGVGSQRMPEPVMTNIQAVSVDLRRVARQEIGAGAQARTVPSKVDVPRPSSSRMTSERLLAWLVADICVS